MSSPTGLTRRLSAWTYGRQRLGRAAPEPREALRDVVAVYSNHPTAPLALLARSRALTTDEFGALEREREAVRLMAMRGSIFLLPTATVARIFAATRQPFSSHARLLARAGLTPESYARLKARVLDVVREPLLPRELAALLGGQSGAKDTAGAERVAVGVRIMAYEGLVLRVGVNLRANALRYVPTEAWLGRPLADHDPAEALAWLAGEYLRGYGPARVADFAWWSGVSRSRAGAALDALDTIDLGDGLLTLSGDRDDFARAALLDPDTLDILPKWDAYTMGYAPDGRRRLLDDAHLPHAYSQGGGGTFAGDGLPLILRGGRAVATWSHRFSGNRLTVAVTPFPGETLPPLTCKDAFMPVGELLGASALAVAVG